MRTFYLIISLLVLPIMLFADSRDENPQITYSSGDKTILNNILSELEPYKNLPTGELMTLAGEMLQGSIYKAKTLEKGNYEHLVVNLREFDCTTFVESCMAIARIVKSGKTTFRCFTTELTKIRYRNGMIRGYTSRLHYFTEWILNNEVMGLVEDISYHLGGEKYPVTLSFMSKHPQYYPSLQANSKQLEKIITIEKSVSQHDFFHIPKTLVQERFDDLQAGDIIALTTKIEGLDVTHIGMIYPQNGTIHFMHASSSAKKVIISDITLNQYLNQQSKVTGLLVVRPK